LGIRRRDLTLLTPFNLENAKEKKGTALDSEKLLRKNSSSEGGESKDDRMQDYKGNLIPNVGRTLRQYSGSELVIKKEKRSAIQQFFFHRNGTGRGVILKGHGTRSTKQGSKAPEEMGEGCGGNELLGTGGKSRNSPRNPVGPVKDRGGPKGPREGGSRFGSLTNGLKKVGSI